MPNVGQELLNVPFPEMVLKLACAIAETVQTGHGELRNC